MLTEHQINTEIKEKYAKWMEEPFFATEREEPIVLPSNFQELYKRVLFKAPPDLRQQNTVYLTKLSDMDLQSATRIDIRVMLNLITSASFDVLYDDLNAALIDYVTIERLAIAFNKEVGEKDKELTSERNRKLRLINIHPTQADQKLVYAKK